MSNTSYPKGMEKLLSGQINLLTADIRAALLPATYTYSTAHEFTSDLGTRVGSDVALADRSVAGGVFDASDAETSPLSPGNNVHSVAIFVDTGNASTSPLLFFYDSVPGLPADTNGGAIKLRWSNGPSKIASLTAPFVPAGGELVMRAGVNFLADTLKVVLLPSSLNLATAASYQYLANFGTVIGAPQTLTGKTITGGVLDADDIEFGVVGGGTVGSALLYKDTGNPATSPALQIITDIAGFPFAANYGELTLRWSNGAAKIFSLIPA